MCPEEAPAEQEYARSRDENELSTTLANALSVERLKELRNTSH